MQVTDSTSTHLLITDDLLFGENELKVEETFDDASDTFLDLFLAEWLKSKLTLSFSLCFLTLGVEFSDVSSWSHSFLFLIFSFNRSPCNFWRESSFFLFSLDFCMQILFCSLIKHFSSSENSFLFCILFYLCFLFSCSLFVAFAQNFLILSAEVDWISFFGRPIVPDNT